MASANTIAVPKSKPISMIYFNLGFKRNFSQYEESKEEFFRLVIAKLLTLKHSNNKELNNIRNYLVEIRHKLPIKFESKNKQPNQ